MEADKMYSKILNQNHLLKEQSYKIFDLHLHILRPK